MTISQLNLENFGAIKRAQLDFVPQGFNVLSGDIGQGKSHIIYSIAFLLLNTVKKRRIDNYLNWDAESFLVEMLFSHGGQSYQVRTTYDGSTNRYLKYNGNEITESSGVTAELARLFDPSLYKASMMSFQDEADIVSSTPAVRRDNFRKIYNLEFDEQIAEFSSLVEKLKTEKLKPIEDRILILENKEYTIRELKPFPFDVEDKKRYEVELKDKKLSLQDIEQQIAEYDAQVQRKEKLAREITDQNQYYFMVSNKWEESKKAKDTTQIQLQELENDDRVERLQQQLEQTDFEEELKRLQQSLQKIRTPVVVEIDENIHDDINTLQSQINDLRVDAKSLQSKIVLVKQGKCPTCGNDFSGVDVSQLEDQHNEIVKQGKNLKSQLEEKQKQVEAYRKYEQEKERADSKRQLIQSQIENEKDKIESRKAQMQNEIASTCQQVKTEKQHLQQQIDSFQERIDEYADTIKRTKEKIDELKEEEASIVTDEKPAIPEKLKLEIASIEEQLQLYNSIVETNKVLQQQNEEMEVEKRDDQKELSRLISQRDDLLVDIERWERGTVILKKEFPNYVIHSTLGNVENFSNDFLDKAYNGRYHIGMQETKSGIEVVYGKQKKDVSISSGGEQDLFNLGLKHAFCKITGLGVLILDEVDKFMSSSMSKHVFSLLNDMIVDPEDEINQVFVVTHNNETKEMLAVDLDARVFHVQDGFVTKE